MIDSTLRGLRSFVKQALSRADQALLLGPIALSACARTAQTDDGVVIPEPPTATVSTTAIAPPQTATPKGCQVSPIKVTGCGGGEVLVESLAACGLPTEGDLPAARCKELCGSFQARGCNVFKTREGKDAVFCAAANPCLGRLPRRARPARNADPDTTASFLRRAARLELLSVDAFHELRASLALHGAPPALRVACAVAAKDEARHALTMRQQLAARGLRPPPRRPVAGAVFRSLEGLALHNEREGVVGEAWGALIAAYQARHAEDAGLRAKMQVIADEELAHAALSMAISAWAHARLDARGRRRLARARERATQRIAARPERLAEDARTELGLPPPHLRAELAASLRSFLLSSAPATPR